MNEVEAVKTVEDIERIEKLLFKHGNQDFSDIWKLGINVAFRISDLLAIEYSDLDLVKRELTLIESILNMLFDWIKEQSLVAISSLIGFFIGYKAG